jgi:predicted ATPase
VQDRFPDGAHLVKLEAVTDPGLVPATMLHAMGLQESGAASPLVSLVAYLKDRRTFLLIDNFEQVVDAALDINHLIEECPHVKFFITSRVRLNLRAEHEFPVPPLSVPPTEEHDLEAISKIPSVRLFVARAQKIGRGFTLTEENASAVAEICTRLDGLPLAIELAAARTRVLSPASMLQRLDDRLSLLTTGDRDLPERHHTLRAAVEWSFDLLKEEQRALFIRCGVFRGGCTLDAAETICDPRGERSVLEGTEALVENSLVRQIATDGEPRFAMFETVREYAAERLHALEDRELIEERRSTYYLDLLDSSYEGLRSSRQQEWVDRIDNDNDNIRATLRWCIDHEHFDKAADAGWVLWLLWWVRDYLAEGRRWMEEVLSHGDRLSDLGRARASAVSGVMAFWQLDYGTALTLFLESLETFRSLGDEIGVALCQLPLALVQAGLGQPEEAMPRYRESLALFEKAGDTWGLSVTYNAMCWLATGMEMEEVTDEMFEEGVGAARRAGTEQELGMALGNLGRRYAFRGALDEGESKIKQGLMLLATNHLRGIATTQIESLAEIAILKGDASRAAKLYGAASEIRSQLGSPLGDPFYSKLQARVRAAEELLGPEAFQFEWESGRKMDFDTAAEYALTAGAMSK